MIAPLTAAAKPAPPSITGVITDGGGKTVAGAAIQLNAMVTDTAGMHSRVVGTATTDASGRYSVAYPSGGSVADLAKLNGGLINWELDASYTVAGQTFFDSSVFQDVHGLVDPVPGVNAAAYASTATVHNLKPAKIATSLDSSAANAAAANPNVVCTWYWAGTGHSTVGSAVIGEPHAFYDVTIDYRYTSGSSSTLGIAYNDGGGWKQNGSVGLTNSSSAYFDTGVKGPYWAKYIIGDFTSVNNVLRNTCGISSSTQEWVATGWTGAARYGGDTSSLDGSGGPLYAQAVNRGWTAVYPQGSSFNRTNGAGLTYSGGFTIPLIGVSISARTDYSSSTSYTWQFGSGGFDHVLFGGNDYVSRSWVVYSY